MSDETANSAAMPALYKALAKFQGECPPILKDKEARIKENYNYKYASIGTIISTIRGSLQASGLSQSQSIMDKDGGGSMLVTKVFHEAGGQLESRLTLPIGSMKPQDFGSLLTYYRRYALTALLGIAADDDDDGQAAQNAVATAAQKPTITPASVMPRDEIDRHKKEIGVAETEAAWKEKWNAAAKEANEKYRDQHAYNELKTAAGVRWPHVKGKTGKMGEEELARWIAAIKAATTQEDCEAEIDAALARADHEFKDADARKKITDVAMQRLEQLRVAGKATAYEKAAEIEKKGIGDFVA